MSVGAGADSGHEYLLKYYLMTGQKDTFVLDMCEPPQAFTHIFIDSDSNDHGSNETAHAVRAVDSDQVIVGILLIITIVSPLCDSIPRTRTDPNIQARSITAPLLRSWSRMSKAPC